MVKSSADALLTVINDILDFSKIEAGKLDLEPIDFDLRDSLGDTLQALGPARPQEGAGAGLPRRARRARRPGRATPAGCGRSSSTWSATRSSSPSGARSSSAVEARVADATARSCLALRRQRHRHRHPAREAADALRGLRAGRQLDDAQVRRHRAGPGDLGPAGRADGRAHLGRERGRPGQHVPLHRPLRPAAQAGGRPAAAEPAAGARPAASWSWTTTRRTG